ADEGGGAGGVRGPHGCPQGWGNAPPRGEYATHRWGGGVRLLLAFRPGMLFIKTPFFPPPVALLPPDVPRKSVNIPPPNHFPQINHATHPQNLFSPNGVGFAGNGPAGAGGLKVKDDRTRTQVAKLIGKLEDGFLRGRQGREGPEQRRVPPQRGVGAKRVSWCDRGKEDGVALGPGAGPTAPLVTALVHRPQKRITEQLTPHVPLQVVTAM